MSSIISAKAIQALRPGQFLWHETLRGFGVRGLKSGAAYLVRYRAGKGRGAPQRFMTIGLHGGLDSSGKPWTPKSAYDRAVILLGKAKDGGDPAMAGRDLSFDTLGALCDRYLQDAKDGRILDRRGRPKKASTIATDGYRVEAHIKKLLGKVRVIDLTRASVEAAMQKIADGKSKGDGSSTKLRGKRNARGGKGTATRTMGLLGAILSYGVRLGLRPDNPAAGIRRYADGRRKRRLNPGEMRALGSAIRTEKSTVTALTHFLAVSGWRRSEAVNLTWAEIDLETHTATLQDSKTGRSMRALSSEACLIVAAQPQAGRFVFPSSRNSEGDGLEQRPTMAFPHQFVALRKRAELPSDVTPNVLRHTFASIGSDLGFSEATVGTLIGHQGRTITSRYTHAADAVLVSAANAIAAEVENQLFRGAYRPSLEIVYRSDTLAAEDNSAAASLAKDRGRKLRRKKVVGEDLV